LNTEEINKSLLMAGSFEFFSLRYLWFIF